MDHATWISFSNEELDMLRKLLAYVEENTDRDTEIGLIRAKIDQYTSPESKDQRYRDAAAQQSWVRDGECEIDDHAVVSGSDEGAYVMAWVWASREDAGMCRTPGCDEDAADGEGFDVDEVIVEARGEAVVSEERGEDFGVEVRDRADEVRAVRHPGDDVSGGGRVDYSSFRYGEDIGLGPGRPEFDGVAADVLSCTEPHGLRVPFPETPDVERERVGVGQVEGVELDEELDAALAFVVAADQCDVPRAPVGSQGRRLAVDGTDRGHRGSPSWVAS